MQRRGSFHFHFLLRAECLCDVLGRNSGSIEGQLDSWLCWHSSAWRATDVAEVEEPPTAIGMAQDLLGRMQDLLDEEDWTGAS